MESKKISLSELKKMMSPKEMKNVTGGSGGSGCCISYTGPGPGNKHCVDNCEDDGGAYGCGCNTADAKATCGC